MPYYSSGDYYGQGDYYQGDPGILGSISKFFGKVAHVAIQSTPVGRALSGIASIALKHKTNPILRAAASIVPGNTIGYEDLANQAAAGGLPPLALGPGPAGVGVIGGHSTTAPVPMGGGGFHVRATHMNKATYYRRGGGTQNLTPGLVPKGSIYVTNRRMNPGNSRALGRAITRISAFGRLVKRTKKTVARANRAVGNVHRAPAKRRIGK
jgi:hypothetical protein